MMSFISCRDKMKFSRNESPDLPSYSSKRIQFVRAWPSLSFHIFYVKCPMILLENKNTCIDFTGADPELLMRGWGGSIWSNVRTYPTYLERQAWTNSVDPDQTPENAASDLGPLCLPLILQFYTESNSQIVKWTWS